VGGVGKPCRDPRTGVVHGESLHNTNTAGRQLPRVNWQVVGRGWQDDPCCAGYVCLLLSGPAHRTHCEQGKLRVI
jgi:hypothetical protein